MAARWSLIDFNGMNLNGPVRCLVDLTFGVNRSVNRHTKFQFNYRHAFLDDPTSGKSDADVAALFTQLRF